MKTVTKIEGIDTVNDLLTRVAPREANNLMRATIHGVAGDIAREAKRHMSVDTGTMRKATKTRRRKVRQGLIRSDVLVTKAAFYWRFREYGQGPDGTEDAMFMKAVEWFRARMADIFRVQFGKKLEARLKRLARS